MSTYTIINPEIEHYVYSHTRPESPLLENLIKETQETMENPHMMSGKVVGCLLKTLIAISKTKYILEIGMFTGYSALNMAEALPKDGRLITCEVDKKAEKMARKFFEQSPDGYKIEIKMGPALDTLKTLDVFKNNQFFLDFVFIDADKSNYLNYYKAVLPKVRSGGLIVFDNALWGGKVMHPETQSSRIIAETNNYIFSDPTVENVLLTVRDGLNIVRKL